MGDLTTGVQEAFTNGIISFMGELNWHYIISLMIIVNIFNKLIPLYKKISAFGYEIRLSASYRVAIFGFLLALLYFYLSGDRSRHLVQNLFESMLAAMCMHAWVFQYVFKYLDKKFAKNEHI